MSKGMRTDGEEGSSVLEIRSLGAHFTKKSKNAHSCPGKIGIEEVGWVKKVWCVYVVEYYSVVTKDVCHL